MNPYEKYSWPYSYTHPRPENPVRRLQTVSINDHFEPEPDPYRPVCPYCKSESDLRSRGTRTSRTYPNDVRVICLCTNCDRYLTLPVGMHLPEKPRKTPLVPEAEVATDVRPVCPHCGSDHIWRRGSIGEGSTGSQRWGCADCSRRFVSDPGKHTRAKEQEKENRVDRRHNWNALKGRKPEDAQEEAVALVRFVEQKNCDPREIRELIGYTDNEKRCLEDLAALGLIASAQVSSVLNFRDEVLRKFNNLVDTELASLIAPEDVSHLVTDQDAKVKK
jgi:transposase-like protein